MRITTGTPNWPPDMWRSVAALFMIWSSASRLKLTVMISTMGRMPGHRGADARAGEAGFGKRRVADALGPEFVQQALGDGIAAAVVADILAHQEHAVVALHGLADGLLHGLAIGDLDRRSCRRCGLWRGRAVLGRDMSA